MRYAKKIKRNTWITAVGLLLCFAFFRRYDEIRSVFSETASICLRQLIPPMFPMMALTGFLTRIGPPSFLADRLSAFSFAFVFGQIGGYPVGLRLSAAAKRDRSAGEIPRAAVLSNVNPGPAFTVLAVGKGMFGSSAIGGSLYCSVTAANLIVMFLIRRFRKERRDAAGYGHPDHAPPGQELVDAVNDAIAGCVSVTAWILLFSVLRCCAEPIFSRSVLLTFTAEVTAAVREAADRASPVLCAFSLGFGGLCLTAQVFPQLRELGIGPAEYLLVRALCGTAAALAEYLVLILVPFPTQTVSTVNPKTEFRAGGPGVISLLICCIVFIRETADTCIPRKRKRKYRIPLATKKNI